MMVIPAGWCAMGRGRRIDTEDMDLRRGLVLRALEAYAGRLTAGSPLSARSLRTRSATMIVPSSPIQPNGPASSSWPPKNSERLLAGEDAFGAWHVTEERGSRDRDPAPGRRQGNRRGAWVVVWGQHVGGFYLPAQQLAPKTLLDVREPWLPC